MIESKRRSRQLNYPRFVTKAIRPVGGMFKFDVEGDMPPTASPDMQNCFVLEGRLCKRPGYVKFGANGVGSQVMGIFGTQDEENNTHLVAVTTTALWKYDFGGRSWVKLDGPILTSEATQWFSFENSQNSICFSNGVDQIMRHDISTLSTTYDVLSPEAPIARYITRFADRLCSAYTTEGGISKPFRLRRPVAGNHADWNGAGSGFNDQTEYPYHLRGIRKIGEGMCVYTERSIHVAERTGQALAPYTLKVKTEGVGLYGERTLQPLPGSSGHIFMGNDDIYLFNGSQERGVAHAIRDYIFNSVTPQSIRSNFGIVMSDTQEYLMFAAQGGAQTPNSVWVFNYGRSIWYPWEVLGTGNIPGPTCATLCRNDDTTTIDELVGTMDQQNWEYDSRLLASAYPSMITGHVDGNLYKWGTQYPSDGGADIIAWWTSQDMEWDDIDPSMPPSRITLRSLGVKYFDAGTAVHCRIYFSTDGGGTWQGPYDMTLPTGSPGGIREASINVQVTGERVRFKFVHRHNTETFQIGEFNAVLELREPIYT